MDFPDSIRSPVMSVKEFGPHDGLGKGALLLVLASAMFAIMGAGIKTISPDLPVEMIVFFRNLFGLTCLAPWLLRAGAVGLATQRFPSHTVRTLSGLAAMYCFFFALGHLQLGEAVLLNFSAPLFIPPLALFWLREPVSRALLWALGVGLAGIILILKPTTGIINPVAVVGLLSGLFAAVATVSVRGLSRTEPAERIVFYFAALGTLASGVAVPWAWVTPDPTQWITLIGIGVFATGGQVFLTRGITLVPAARVGPLTYTSVVFAAVIGWAVWGELLDLVTLVGGALVCVGGVLVLRGQRSDRAIPEG